jgi:hypothetical protein
VTAILAIITLSNRSFHSSAVKFDLSAMDVPPLQLSHQRAGNRRHARDSAKLPAQDPAQDQFESTIVTPKSNPNDIKDGSLAHFHVWQLCLALHTPNRRWLECILAKSGGCPAMMSIRARWHHLTERTTLSKAVGHAAL